MVVIKYFSEAVLNKDNSLQKFLYVQLFKDFFFALLRIFHLWGVKLNFKTGQKLENVKSYKIKEIHGQ
jgi:hypothetical protein